MIELKLPLILASGSPRRKELLKTMGLEYIVDVSDADESYIAAPEETVMELSRRKAEAVALRHPQALVLAADTIVYNGKILGKPETEERAIEMLKELSGKWHSVFSGMTLINTRTGKMIQRACETRVHFVELADDEIRSYVGTGEPLDKAGAYGIQGDFSIHIKEIHGDYNNVVGLPIGRLYQELKNI